MLNSEDNELLCRVGPGEPMGELMRRYWLPVLLPSELPEPDCEPVRVRLLGEDLVAFRDTSGCMGLLGALCAHRRAELWFGRNEENGLRCVYHGWKYDVEGNCVDMPNEPPESNFRDKIHHKAYPCVQRGGIIWPYMGPQNQPLPPLPDLESNLAPDGHVYVTKRVQESNYAQALEGGIDSSHVGFLHSAVRPDAYLSTPEGMTRSMMGEGNLLMRDRAPRFEVIDTDCGVMIGARRNADEEQYYRRINHFWMPFYAMAPAGGQDPLSRWSGWVPMDDELTMRWTAEWHPARPLDDEELTYLRASGNKPHHIGVDDYMPASTRPGGAFYGKRNRSNDYLIDRKLQKMETYTGIVGNGPQDQATQEGMGAIVDRAEEHLGSSDAGIIATRRFLLRAAKALRDHGVTPAGAQTPRAYRVRSAGLMARKEAPWLEAAKEYIAARPGVNYAQP